jgi:aarF domain-containing kinase
VFKGTIRDANPASGKTSSSQGVDVAIKMIHPNVESMVHADMELLSMFARWLDKFPSLEMLNLGDTLTEFGDMMNRQLDLR